LPFSVYFHHRDLACRNLLVVKEGDRYSVKVSDFGEETHFLFSSLLMAVQSGLSRRNEYVASKSKIPIRWSAPETLKSGFSTSKSDVWSFGVVVWEILNFGLSI
jgi:serine/threonine protein kinase